MENYYPRLSEGCNCGKKKPNPKLSSFQRPSPATKITRPIIRRTGPGSSKLHESMKLNEEKSKYDIKRISKIALNNVSSWINERDFNYYKNEFDKLQRNGASFDKLKKYTYDFLDRNIDNFIDIFSRYNHIERDFFEENRIELLENILDRALVSSKPSEQSEPEQSKYQEKDDIEEIISKSKEKEAKLKSYSQMSQYELRKEVDKALDNKDFDTLKKIQPYLKEGFLKSHVNDILNEQYLIKPLL